MKVIYKTAIKLVLTIIGFFACTLLVISTWKALAFLVGADPDYYVGKQTLLVLMPFIPVLRGIWWDDNKIQHKAMAIAITASGAALVAAFLIYAGKESTDAMIASEDWRSILQIVSALKLIISLSCLWLTHKAYQSVLRLVSGKK